jgi:hypothetical protein
MPEPTPAVTAAWEAALPQDDRLQRKKMFGAPCAFVNRQMFFAIFGDTLVARVGPERVRTLAEQAGMQPFVPTPGRPWEDCLQVELSVDASTLSALAREALGWAEAIPRRVKRPRY